MIDKWIDRARKHVALTVLVALVIWLIPVVISIDANRLARQANDFLELQAAPHLDSTEIFYGAAFSPDRRDGFCRHVLLLSNRGGIGTAVFSVDTSLAVGSQVVSPTSIATGNDETVQYYTTFYADAADAPPLSEAPTISTTSRIQPLYSYLLVPTGQMVAFILDTEVIGHSRPVDQPNIAPGASGPEIQVTQTGDNISVQYTLHFPNNQQITTHTLGCLTLGQ